MARDNYVTFDNVDGKALIFKNFAGRPGTFNNEGERSFCLVVDEETKNELEARGLNVRHRVRQFEDQEIETLYLPIKVNFNSKRPPQINQVSKNGMTQLDEDTIDVLDWAEIISAKIAINIYNWHYAGKSGYSAYLQELLVEIEDESFASQYRREHDQA